MCRIPILPKWLRPSVSSYDMESATASEMVGKLYGAMREMQEDYNKFSEEISKEVRNFTASSTKEIQEFKDSIEKRLMCKFEELEYRYNVLKVELTHHADEKIEEIYEKYMDGYLSEIVSAKIANGEINITLVYDPETESLQMTTQEE